MNRERIRIRFRHIASNVFVRNVVTLAGGTALAQAVGLAFAIVLAWLYSPHDFGIFGVFYAIGAFGSSVFTLKYDLAVVLPKSDVEAKMLSWIASACVLMTSIVAAVILVIINPWMRQVYGSSAMAWWPVLGALLGFLFAETYNTQYWLNRRGMYRAIAQNNVLQTFAAGACQLGLFFAAGDFRGLIIGQLMAQAIALVTMKIRAGRYLYSSLPDDAPQFRDVIRKYREMPLLNLPTAVVNSGSSNGLPLTVGLRGSETLGQFNQAWKIMYVPAVLFTSSVTQVFYREMANTAPSSLYRLTKKTISKLAIVAIGPFILLALIAPTLFPLVFGPQWVEAGQLSRYITPWTYMMVVTAPLANLFIVTKNQGILLAYSTLIGALPILILLVSPLALAPTLLIVTSAMCIAHGGMIVVGLLCAKRFGQLNAA
ncbi:MAG: oligosaccharide flippase family protein [Arcanobacterium sp.]|nr:oligosaccharide flippase family protein [Arcanobacterium sp.]